MLYMILMAVVALGVAVFALQNTMIVELSFLSWTFSANLVLVILLSALAGMVIILCWALKMKAQHIWRTMKLNNQISTLEQDREILRDKVKKLEAAAGTNVSAGVADAGAVDAAAADGTDKKKDDPGSVPEKA